MTQNDNRDNREIVGSFSSHQAADIVDISYRMLDHWVSKVGILRPSLENWAGSGRRRRFNYQDLLKLRIIKSLRDKGITLQKIHEAFEAAGQLGIDVTKSSVAVERRRIFAHSGNEVFELKGHAAQPLLSLAFSPLDEVTAHVDNSILERHSEHAPILRSTFIEPGAIQLSFDWESDSAVSS